MSTPRATGPHEHLGLAGRLASYFQDARITPLIALTALLLGLFAVLVTPREEEPQINVTMANVLVPFPGASAADVEAQVAQPAEQVLGQMAGIDHLYAVSRPGLAVLTVQFQVGVPRTEALVRLYDTIHSHGDWLPANLGTLPPLIKPKGIDDVPIVTLTLFAKDAQGGQSATASPLVLEQVAHSLEAELKRVPGTREVTTYGGPRRTIGIALDPQRLAAQGLTVADLRQALAGANANLPAGDLLVPTEKGAQRLAVEVGPFLDSAAAVGEVVVGVHGGKPVFLRDVATLSDGPAPATRYVWHGTGPAAAQARNEAGTEAAASNTTIAPGADHPAVTLAITKKPGENAVEVADALLKRVDALHNTLLPEGVEVAVTRNYGETANDKAQKLIHKLLFATASVVALVALALGRREAGIVGLAVILTLMATLFASWAWGFTLNRVSLFALIFSIGILVDDAIVVVENIHRHRLLDPGAPLLALIPRAVDEVGGPTILATLTVIAALLPMAFVSGLMGPYMSPIPINASMGMVISLAVAFVVTPWLAARWLPKQAAHHDGLAARLQPLAARVFAPFLDDARGPRQRRRLGLAVAGLIALSLALPVLQWVVLKMLPFDNKSEFQVVVDMPNGTPLETTAAALGEMTAYLATVPEVADYQAYAGTSAPINFNGLVRQYYLRDGGEVGDIQVNLADKHHRSAQSHAIAQRVRPALAAIGTSYGARVKVVEVPPGPPVLSPIVAEITGPSEAGRNQLAEAVRRVFQQTSGVVDVDGTHNAPAPKTLLAVDKDKAARAGVSQQAIVATLAAGLAGEDVTYLRDSAKYPVPLQLRLADSSRGNDQALLALTVRGAGGALVPIRELVSARPATVDEARYRKDGLPVTYVMGDVSDYGDGHTRAGLPDSPLYGMFALRSGIGKIVAPDGGPVTETFIRQADDAYRGYGLKWDGEWQITYETFRDMGAAYAVGLILIYLLVVAHFGSYLAPLVIMAPIPLTLIGVMPGHALLGAPFTATSMIGMIALAGIIVRNSILLVDFIRLEVEAGVPFKDAIVRSAATRAQPIALTALAAMTGAFFILDDPIFNGLAISLIFGILVSTLLTLVVIPLLYFVAYRQRGGRL